MDRKRLQETREWVRKELASSAEFWLKYGMDKEHGGVYTCIDRTGRLFSTDKSVWMQGRCGWTYAYLCTVYGTRPEWLEASKSCLDFMEKHCINREADRRRQAAAPAPLLLLRGLLRPGQRGVLRGHGGQGVPGAGPPGL